MGKEVEGKGRQGKMDRDEQYEEARELLSGALDPNPNPNPNPNPDPDPNPDP